MALATLLAHQGGWDEMLMVGGPILVFWLILRAANKRAASRGAELLGTDTSASTASDISPE